MRSLFDVLNQLPAHTSNRQDLCAAPTHTHTHTVHQLNNGDAAVIAISLAAHLIP